VPPSLTSLLRVLLCTTTLPLLGAATDGQGLYNKSCSACHGVDGKGQTKIGQKIGAKDLSQSKLTDAEIEKQVREGKLGDDGKIKMPSFKDAFTPEEVKALVAYVKAFRK
jgi:mono/diheme cytochrome c family protein